MKKMDCYRLSFYANERLVVNFKFDSSIDRSVLHKKS